MLGVHKLSCDFHYKKLGNDSTEADGITPKQRELQAFPSW